MCFFSAQQQEAFQLTEKKLTAGWIGKSQRRQRVDDTIVACLLSIGRFNANDGNNNFRWNPRLLFNQWLRRVYFPAKNFTPPFYTGIGHEYFCDIYTKACSRRASEIFFENIVFYFDSLKQLIKLGFVELVRCHHFTDKRINKIPSL